MKDQKSGAWGLSPYTEENCDELREQGMCFFEGTFVNLEYDKCPHRKHHTTNADRIRTMSDEELAEFMCHNVSNGTVNCAFCAAAEFCRAGHNGWLDWLKEEAKE